MLSKKDRADFKRWLFALGLVFILVGGYFAYPWLRTRLGRARRLGEWLNNSAAHPDWAIQAGERCNSAPFVMPTSGFVGFIWDDSFRPGNRHQGIDIFGGGGPGKVPVLAAYDGYLTRLPGWKATVIIRVSEDPLLSGRQIWTYYTHMADNSGGSFVSPEFPPGAAEVFIKAGTFLGYQGDFSGDPDNPVGVHLHFSIVQDDGRGGFLNELKIENTLDPTPYLGLILNAGQNPNGIVTCEPQVDEGQASKPAKLLKSGR
jgi:murein DD-endopeptidase MepM/ murein hydrolase activator NlpD